MIRDMHSAQAKAGMAIMALVGSAFEAPILAASPVVSSAITSASPVISNFTYGDISRYAGMQMTANAIGQGVGLVVNKKDFFGNFNYFEFATSGLNGLAPLAIGSSLNISYNSVFGNDPLVGTSNEASSNFLTGLLVNGINSKLQLPKSVMTDASFITYQGIINTSSSAIGSTILNNE